MYKRETKVNYYILKLAAFSSTGFACLPLMDKFIYGFISVELRRNIKIEKTDTKIQNYYTNEYVVYTSPMVGRNASEIVRLFGTQWK